MKSLELHWRILFGMVLGVLFGFIMTQVQGGVAFVSDWILPFGTIFVKLLKFIAIPLILASLTKGISDLKDISRFASIGIKTIFIYVITTVFAITIGLLLVNLFRPGDGVSENSINKLTNSYAENISIQSKISEAGNQMERGPLDFIVDMVPENAFFALSNNKLMLQVIFLSIFLGICLLMIETNRAKPLRDIFESLNDVVLKMVDLIMKTAPIAVFALIANVIVSSGDSKLLSALLLYSSVVVFGLFLMIVFYLFIFFIVTRKNPFLFIQQISPAQLLAFSTSSSAATLPVTMERVEEHVGVDKEVSSFVLPVGATINMDGTSLYQAVAAVFISQALNFDLTFSDQLTIVLTALLASIGSAAVP